MIAPGGHEAEPLARDVRTAGDQVRQTAEEQVALHRVAVLVARGEPPEAVFAAVAEEAGRVVPSADFALVGRYDRASVVEMVGAWSRAGTPRLLGRRVPLGGRNVSTLVFEHHGPVRVAHLADDGSAGTAAARESGARSSAGAPVSLEGRLWGVLVVGSRTGPLPADTEARLAGFTELVATAIANTEARAALTASRARIVAAADTTPRRIERDLHDGAQQRLVSLGLHLRAAQAAAPGLADLKDRVESLGGQICLDSPHGAGTSLCVELPIRG